MGPSQRRDISGMYFFQPLEGGGREPRCFEELDEANRARVLASKDDEFVRSIVRRLLGCVNDLLRYAVMYGNRPLLPWHDANKEVVEAFTDAQAWLEVEGEELRRRCSLSADALRGLSELLDVGRDAGAE